MSDELLAAAELYQDMIEHKILTQQMLTDTERRFQQDPGSVDFTEMWNTVKNYNDSAKKEVERKAAGIPDFEDFTIREPSKVMEARMLADKFVIGRMAISGQSSVFYGGPNVGKTLVALKLLTEAIQAGDVQAGSVYYINADDTYKGIVTKQKLAEQYGFKMLVPSMNGFKADMLAQIMRYRASSDTARGSVVLLDTLKKFTDLMHKGSASSFGDVVRQFTANGGTLISLAHVNKHKNDEGESVYSGTTDIIDDADCAYILDLVEDNGTTRIIKFRNIKDRGDVQQVASYSYKSKSNVSSMSYEELFHSVAAMSFEQAKLAEARAAIADKLAINHETIVVVLECLSEGITGKTQLVAEVVNRTGLAKKKVTRVVDDHTGTDTHQGHRWNHDKGERNSQIYFAL
jgi:hypothetical protein